MKTSNYQINKIQSRSELPFDLLLLADETIEVIEKYIYDSEVYLVKEEEYLQPVAVFALYKISNKEIEIKNIAVSELLQGKGIGTYMIREIKRIAKADRYETIIVGTADCAWKQIHFYEKNGFIKYELKKEFFAENYIEPIIEEGVMLRDMVMLKFNLDHC